MTNKTFLYSKRKINIVFILFFSLFLYQCSNGSAPLIEDDVVEDVFIEADGVIEVRVLARSDTIPPDWVNMKWEIDQDSLNNKVIYLMIEENSVNLEQAEALLDSEYLERLRIALRAVFISEFNQDNILDVNDVLDNIAIEKALYVDDYWEFLQETYSNHSVNYYRYIRRYAFDYLLFEDNIIAESNN